MEAEKTSGNPLGHGLGTCPVQITGMMGRMGVAWSWKIGFMGLKKIPPDKSLVASFQSSVWAKALIGIAREWILVWPGKKEGGNLSQTSP